MVFRLHLQATMNDLKTEVNLTMIEMPDCYSSFRSRQAENYLFPRTERNFGYIRDAVKRTLSII